MKTKLLIAFAIIFALTIFVAAYFGPKNNFSDKISVVASIYPIAEFAKGAGGSLVNVAYITPQGVEPHDYEPGPRDVERAYAAKLFVFSGWSELDPWAKKIAAGWNNSQRRYLELNKNIELAGAAPGVDPHVWLDPSLAAIVVKAIRDDLIILDPIHKDDYVRYGENYLQKLQALDEEIARGLSTCQSRTMVVSHAAFNYFAKRYNLEVINLAGLSPEEEPSAKQLAQISAVVKQNRIKYIFYETLVSPKLAETLARETGARAQVLNPIEGITSVEEANGENYFSLMRKNFAILKDALICQ